MSKRSGFITVIGVSFIILSIFSLIWSFLVFGIGGLTTVFSSLFGMESLNAFGTSSTWNGFIGILSAILQMSVGFGLLGLKHWAWTLSFVTVGVTVVEALIGIFNGGFLAVCCGGLGLIFPLFVLFYLLKPNVRQLFN